jgi:hypothetical protein
LGTSPERAFEILSDARRENRLERERHPGGDVWKRMTDDVVRIR